MTKLPIKDSSEYDEKAEAKIRAVIERHAAYAESGSTFDPTGKYLCGACAFREGTKACIIVSGRISFATGSCSLWDLSKPPVDSFPKMLSQIEAGYSERPESKGFGCSRCEYADSLRDKEGIRNQANNQRLWCGFWGLRVRALACCSEEDGNDLVLAPGEKSSTQSEE